MMTPSATPMQEDDSADAPPESGQQSTVEIPLASFGGNPPQEGSTIQLKVVSVDTQNGVVNAMPMQGAPDDDGGSDSMASEFDKPPMKGAS
jgi:hypothetical protein